MKPFLIAVLAATVGASLAGPVMAQIVVIDRTRRVVVAPPRPTPPPVVYEVRKVDVNVTVRDQIATVQLSQVFKNVSGRALEAQLLFPMPTDAAISQLTLLVDGGEFTGRILKKEEARRIYEEIVRRRRDPALLEYMGHGLFQTSVFPVPPGAERTVQIRYTQLLKQDAGLTSLLLPIGTNRHAHHPIGTLNVNVQIESATPLRSVYSPTHEVSVKRSGEHRANCRLTLNQVHSPDDLRLLFGAGEESVGGNLISYWPKDEEVDNGYFVLLVSPGIEPVNAEPVPRSLVFILDRSGSMTGEKIKQARDALKFLVRQLRPRDTFNIVAYDSVVESFRPELQRADETGIEAALGFVDGLFAGGSTNIDSALQTGLGMLKSRDVPSYVLFMTDGLATVGEKNEMHIAANAKTANRVGARMFNFGVGYDVNSRLLDRLSRGNRGQSVFVRPKEDIEASVSNLYNRIGRPMLTDVSVKFEFDEVRDEATPPPISRSYPKELTDLFYGEQLVLVGRYRKPGRAKVTVSGLLNGKRQVFSIPVTFSEPSKDESHSFAEKLWATRRVGELIDELDLHGHNQELVNELVALSIQHGIITPYTSFLADERTELAASGNRDRAAAAVRRGLGSTGGRGGFGQRELKQRLQVAATASAPKPSAGVAREVADLAKNAPAGGKAVLFLEEDGTQRVAASIRQLGRKTFFRRGGQWKDSTVTSTQQSKALRIQQFSKEYFDLAAEHGGTLAKYLVFSEPVVLNLAGRTYQIDPPQE
jgi:Ca-activated chloride channel family protein